VARVLVAATVVWLLGAAPVVSFAAPSSAQTSASSARVDSAVAKLTAARKRSADLSARVTATSSELDRVMAEQQRVSARLGSRALAMYRSGTTGYVSVLLGATSFENFASRWDLLTRMNRQDAEDLVALAIARAKAEKVAKSLMTMQAEQARSIDAADREAASARKSFAANQAALREYEAKVAAAAKAADAARAAASAKATAKSTVRRAGKAAPKKPDATQALAGSGEWKSGLASHYSKTFTGRGASGASIGPYSMMVAHETLPFHTLLEIEYNGKRCVASVEDRGPYSGARIFDLGPGVVRALGFNGVHPVRYRVIKR
jgi:rare lipoprotein A (peptidoglycan hydrolase)